MANSIVSQRDNQLERQRAGYIQLSLTNFTNNDEPTIAAGSVVEISGTLYSVTGNESITGWAGMSNGPVWVKLVPSGTDPFTAEYTDVAPTWFDAKQGWYDGTGTDRYVAGLTKTGASGYEDKFIVAELKRGFIASTGISPFSRVTEFPTAGSHTFDVPNGVYRLKITACSGGGGGGSNGSTSGDNGGNTTVVSVANSIDMFAPRGTGGRGATTGGGEAQDGGNTLEIFTQTPTDFDLLFSGGSGGSGRDGRGGEGGSSYFAGNTGSLTGGTLPSAGRDASSARRGTGAGGNGANNTGASGGGGSGASTIIKFAEVTPGTALTVTVGAGGSGGGTGSNKGGDGAPGIVVIEY